MLLNKGPCSATTISASKIKRTPDNDRLKVQQYYERCLYMLDNWPQADLSRPRHHAHRPP